MAQLVNMRQRIKAIETIKKITHAMRLISMSTHSQLKSKQSALQQYKKQITHITGILKKELNTLDTISTSISKTQNNKPQLIILVGSEKGLCGNFNVQLFKFFELDAQTQKNAKIITVGKYASDYIEQTGKTIINKYKKVGPNNFVNIANQIADYIFQHSQDYSNVLAYSNYPQTFFFQKPTVSTILPISEAHSSTQQSSTDYILEQPPQELYKDLYELNLKTTLQDILYNSLVAEQAARFVSMDSSTRNAESLLTSMKLEYNKERQAAITRELTELVGSFL